MAAVAEQDVAAEDGVDVGETCDELASSFLDVDLASPYSSHPFGDAMEVVGAGESVAEAAALDAVVGDEGLVVAMILRTYDSKAFELKKTK